MIRRLEAHKMALEWAKREGVKLKGDCTRCADVWCIFNTTPTDILPSDESRGGVVQFSCGSRETDHLIPDDALTVMPIVPDIIVDVRTSGAFTAGGICVVAIGR